MTDLNPSVLTHPNPATRFGVAASAASPVDQGGPGRTGRSEAAASPVNLPALELHSPRVAPERHRAPVEGPCFEIGGADAALSPGVAPSTAAEVDVLRACTAAEVVCHRKAMKGTGGRHHSRWFGSGEAMKGGSRDPQKLKMRSLRYSLVEWAVELHPIYLAVVPIDRNLGPAVLRASGI